MTKGSPKNRVIRTVYPVLVLLFMLLAVFSIQQDARGSVVDDIERGNTPGEHHDLHFKNAGREQTLSIRLPGGGEILQSSLEISTIPDHDGPGSVFIDIGLDNRFEWEYGGGSEGRWGEQVSLTDGSTRMQDIPNGDPQGLSFYLPMGAEITEASINVSSIPSPEGRDQTFRFNSPKNDFDLDAIDTADMNGDGDLDLIYFDKDQGTIEIIYNGSSTGSKEILKNVRSPVHLRAYEATKHHPSMIISSVPDDDGLQDLLALVVNGADDLDIQYLSRGMVPGSSGFSVNTLSNRFELICFEGSSGNLTTAYMDDQGQFQKEHLLDPPFNVTSIAKADLDGDQDLDMILFPSSGSGNNVTLMIDQGPEAPSTYVVKETRLDLWTHDVTSDLDIDGDGDSEVIATIGNRSLPAMFYLNDKGILDIKWLGFNHTRSTPRTILDAYDPADGVVGYPEDILYLSTFSGLYHVTFASDNGDNLIMRRSRSFDSIPLAPQGGGVDKFISLYRNLSLVQHELLWSTASEISIHGPNGGSIEDIVVPFGGLASIDVQNLILGDYLRSRVKDSYNTDLERFDIKIGGIDGFVGVGDISIDYDISIDISNAPDMDASMLRSLEELTGEWIPISVGVSSAGSLRIGPARIEYDEPPVIDGGLPKRITAPEDSRGMTHFNIQDYIHDDYLLPQGLDVELITIGDVPDEIIFMDRNGNIITQSYKYPDFNGEIEFYFMVSDLRSTELSEIVMLDITPVQDSPIVIGDPGLILLDEGSSTSINLHGQSGVFFDPDGDDMEFKMDMIESYPRGILDHVDMEISDGTLSITSDIFGVGGEIRMMLYAKDDSMDWDAAAKTIMAIEISNVDAPPIRLDNPGTIYLREDQSTPYRIQLDGWIYDMDTRYDEYNFIIHTSSPYLDAFISDLNGKKNLFISPTNDINGLHYILIEMTDGEHSIMDRIDINIEPVNDVPILEFDHVGLLKERGWLVSGHVSDDDSSEGWVEYRIGEGEWTKAWGFKSWSKVIDFPDNDQSTLFVFFRASDGHETSPEEYVRLERPELIPDPPVDNDPPDNGGDDPTDSGDPGKSDGIDLVPDPTHDSQPPWLLFGGLAGVVISVLIFFGWTEIGMIIIATVGGSIYSKLSKKDILNHEIRGLIRGYIIANPGDHYSSIKRNLDLNNGTLAYHLRVLEQNGFIKSMYDGIYKRYYPSNVNISKLKKNVSKQEEIFNIILENPGVTMEEIGRMIGVSRQVVNYHVKNLIRGGVVDYRRDKKSAKFYPSDNGAGSFDRQT